MTKQHRASHKRLSRFGKIYRAFVALNLVLIAAGLFYVWRNLVSYESSMPVHAAEQAAALFEQREDAAIQQLCGFVPAKYEDEQVFSRYLDGKIPADTEITLQRQRSGAGESVFLLTAGDVTLARAVLRQQGEPDAFGRIPWQAEELQEVYEPLEPVTIVAPEFVQVSVNGVALDAAERQEAPVPAGYLGLPESIAGPDQVSYQISGLLEQPQVTAVSEGGQECTARAGEQANEIQIQVKPPQDLIDEVGEIALTAAKTYAQFITNDANFFNVAAYLVPGSEYYTKLTTFYSGWYIDHDFNAFENVAVDEFVQYSPDHVSCKLSFLYVIGRGSKRHEYPSSYEAFLVRTPNGWRVSELIVE